MSERQKTHRKTKIKLKIGLIITFIFSMLIFSGCSSNSTRSYELAESGQYKMTFPFVASKADLNAFTVAALTQKGYTVTRRGDAVRATLKHGGIKPLRIGGGVVSSGDEDA